MTCPNCNGVLYQDEDDIKCLMCGRSIIYKNGQAELKPRGDMGCVSMYYPEKREWIESQKEQLIEASKTMTTIAISQIYGMSRPTWLRIRKKWGIEIRKHK